LARDMANHGGMDLLTILRTYPPGTRVVIHGLASAAGAPYNGTQAVVESWRAEHGRLQLRCENRESLACKLENVRPAPKSGEVESHATSPASVPPPVAPPVAPPPPPTTTNGSPRREAKGAPGGGAGEVADQQVSSHEGACISAGEPSETISHLKSEELTGALSTSAAFRACAEEVLTAMPAPKNRIELVSGDWSGDGHGHSETFVIMSNLEPKALQCAYRAGCELLEFDVHGWSTWAKELPAVERAKFESRGFDIGTLMGEVNDDGSVWLDRYQKDLPLLWLFTAKLGAPRFEYDFACSSRVCIGGSGLWDDD